MKYLALAIITASLFVWSCKPTTVAPVTGANASIIVFNHLGANGNSRGAWSINSDSTGLKQLVSDGYLASAPRNNIFVAISYDSAADLLSLVKGTIGTTSTSIVASARVDGRILNHPHLSPDGQHIVCYAYNGLWSSDSGGLYVIDIAGTNGHWAPTNAAYEAEAEFSPDGSRIAYYGSDHKLHIMNVDGSNLISVGTDVRPGNDFLSLIQWSAAHDRIDFTSYNNNVNSQWYVSSDGRSLTNWLSISSAFATISRPVWSPDGTKLVCLSGTSAADVGVFIANSNGTNMQRLSLPAPTGLSIYNTWSPDGTQLALTAQDLTGSNPTPPGVLFIHNVSTGVTTKLADSVDGVVYWAR